MAAAPRTKTTGWTLLCLLTACVTVASPGSGSAAWAATPAAPDVAPPVAADPAPPAAPPPPYGFGTVNGFGQHAEHERITRAALSCTPQRTGNDCFQPHSLDQLAGKSGTFGAVGVPDVDETFDASAHCDDADFLAVAGYPQSRTAATVTLGRCVNHLKADFSRGVTRAAEMVRAGVVAADEVGLAPDCTFALGVPGRAKCDALEGFGRALHGTQDFYSHSNWTDRADPSRRTGPHNPPGLARTVPAPFLNLAAPAALSTVPASLTTGCFSVWPGGCAGRLTHETLNKDTGLIDAATGAATAPTTSRGQVAGNFGAAVTVAIDSTRGQWKGFQDTLTASYGPAEGARLACALTHDHPVRDC
ncbi:CinY protein [Streptomyces caniferus]|uniref:CinY protein n=1 Tax=Streptomyces caniferus TaxID=285557 RepID=UPI002E2BBFDF|nr:CinY protein [Streptomyces caniferus]